MAECEGESNKRTKKEIDTDLISWRPRLAMRQPASLRCQLNSDAKIRQANVTCSSEIKRAKGRIKRERVETQ